MSSHEDAPRKQPTAGRRRLGKRTRTSGVGRTGARFPSTAILTEPDADASRSMEASRRSGLMADGSNSGWTEAGGAGAGWEPDEVAWPERSRSAGADGGAWPMNDQPDEPGGVVGGVRPAGADVADGVSSARARFGGAECAGVGRPVVGGSGEAGEASGVGRLVGGGSGESGVVAGGVWPVGAEFGEVGDAVGVGQAVGGGGGGFGGGDRQGDGSAGEFGAGWGVAGAVGGFGEVGRVEGGGRSVGELRLGAAMVRPYARTGGRTRARRELAVEALVSVADGGLSAGLTAQGRVITELCVRPRSVAEVAAVLSVPLGVARVLIGDLADDGALIVHPTAGSGGDVPEIELMRRALTGLRGL